jgi:hypothetical protein
MALITNDWYREDAPFWRSAFFRVAKKVGRKLDVVAEDAEDWSSYLVWSNLFKVAPRDGGNPGLLMQRAQEPWCYSLLKKELDTYKPKRVLFMTGYDQWAEPFLDFLRFKAKRLSRDKPVEAFGKIPLSNGASTDVVVTQHPQGKPEEELVDQIAKAFRTL